MTRPHYVRRYDGYARSAPGPWVPEAPAPARIPWRARWAAANPIFRWFVLVGIVLAATSLIMLVSLAAGDAAADGFGPLLPVTPSPTPYPEGWTPR